AGPNFDSELRNSVADAARATYRARRSIKRVDESVTDSFDFAAMEPSKLFAHQRVMSVKKIAPESIAQPCCTFSGTDDVGEKYGGQNTIGLRRWPRAGQKFLDLAQNQIGIAHPREMVFAGQLNEARARNLSRNPA